MNIIQIHHDALESYQSIYHEFLGRYNKSKKQVYGFVEGKDDVTYYRSAIENMLPKGWGIDLWAVGKKDFVIELYYNFDWVRFPRLQILFFIDRDLSYFLEEDIPSDKNIYITEKYSIENDMVSRVTCDRVLTEVYNLNMILKDDKDRILDLFEEQINNFREALIPIMALIIFLKRNGNKICLDDICMHHLFTVKNGKLYVQPKPKKYSNQFEYIHKQCNIPLNHSIDISSVINEFTMADGKNRFIRGKYEMWFFIEFIKSVYESIVMFTSTISSPPKINVTLGHTNAIIIIAPRCCIPDSLTNFLNKTYKKYCKKIKNKIV